MSTTDFQPGDRVLVSLRGLPGMGDVQELVGTVVETDVLLREHLADAARAIGRTWQEQSARHSALLARRGAEALIVVAFDVQPGCPNAVKIAVHPTRLTRL